MAFDFGGFKSFSSQSASSSPRNIYPGQGSTTGMASLMQERQGQDLLRGVIDQYRGILGSQSGQPPVESLQQYLGDRVNFSDVKPEYYGIGGSLSDYLNNYEAQVLAGQNQALRDFDRDRPMGTAGNPYARAAGGTTRDSIMQRARAQAGLGRAQIGMDYGQKAAQQGLAATDMQRQIDTARMQQELDRPKSLAALLAAHVPMTQAVAGPLASLVRPSTGSDYDMSSIQYSY